MKFRNAAPRALILAMQCSIGAMAATGAISGAEAAAATADAAADASAGSDDAASDAILVMGRSLEETLPQERARYGVDMVLVDESEIRASAALDVARALESVPGLYIRSSSGPFSYVDLSLQGSRTKDVLWTMDGIRLNNRLYGGTSPNDTLPASMIERVEVLKGGESLFYGTQAAAGVINVVTRSFADEFGGQVNASVDTWAGYTVDGYVRGALGAHHFVAYAARNHGEGYQRYSVRQPSATDWKRGYALTTAGLKYGIDLAPDLSLNLQYQHTEAKLDNLSPTRVRESRNDRNEEIASIRFDYGGDGPVRFFVKGYFHDWKTAYVNIRNPIPAGPPVVLYPAGTFWGYRDSGGTAVLQLNLHPGLEYLIGYDYQAFSGRDDVLLIAPSKEKVHAGIFQIRTTDALSERGRLAAGLRHNRGDGAKKTVWNVSGRYDLTDSLHVEANGGTSFLLPDAYQLYGNDPCCEAGNPNLKAEQSVNLNAGVGARFDLGGGSLTMKASYFRRRITDLIDVSYDDPAYPDGIHVNADGKVLTDGAELVADAVWPGGWIASASFTYAHMRDKGSSRQRDRTPRQYGKASLAYMPQDRNFGARVAVNWVGDVTSTASGFGRINYGNYALVDVSAHVHPDGAARRHRFGIAIENLFNRAYATRGYASAVSDAGVLDGSNSRFLYYERGVPRTLRATYGVSF